jgi:hypothetical protein
MSVTDDEIKIDLDAIDDSKAKNPDGKDKPDPKPAADAKAPKTDVVTPEDGLAKLQKQLEEEKAARENERRGREDAERRAAAASNSEVAARTQSQSDQLTLINTAIENVQNSNKVLKTDYAAALAAQDFEKAADIQLAMSENAARLIQLDAGKKHLEKMPKPKPSQPADPVEQFASELTPQSAAWIRAHPETVRDARMNRKMLNAHYDALDEKISADTPQYFAYIEKALGFSKDPITPLPDSKIDENDDPTSAASTPTKQRTPPAAPVTRSGNGAGNRANVITLSPEEVEIARATGQTPEEYARNKRDLKKEGRLN